MELWKDTSLTAKWDKQGKRKWKLLRQMYQDTQDEKMEQQRLLEQRAAWVRKCKRRFAEAAAAKARAEKEDEVRTLESLSFLRG